MMGHQVEAAQLFYDFNLERHVPLDALPWRIDRAGVGPVFDNGRAGALLQLVRGFLDGPRADDTDAGRLLLRHQLGAQALRRGPPEPGLSHGERR